MYIFSRLCGVGNCVSWARKSPWNPTPRSPAIESHSIPTGPPLPPTPEPSLMASSVLCPPSSYMSSLFNHAVKQNQQLKRDLEKLAEAPEDAPAALQGQISATLSSFQRTIDSYASAVSNELVPEKREKGEQRLADFRQDLQDARQQLKELRAKREESIAASNRQELFRHRTAQGAQENPYANPNTQQADVTREQGLAREGDVLGYASQQLDDFIAQGRAVLGDLTEQNQMLRSTQKTMLKAAGTLGISSETISKVQHRLNQDKRLFYGGVVVLLVCFYLIIRWLR